MLTHKQQHPIIGIAVGNRKETLSEGVRRAVDDSGLSRRTICLATEIDPAQMSRFMKGNGWLGQDALDRLGAFLGLRVASPTTRKRKRGHR